MFLLDEKYISILFHHPAVVDIHIEKSLERIEELHSFQIYFTLLGEEYLLDKIDNEYLLYLDESFVKIHDADQLIHFLDRNTAEQIVFLLETNHSTSI